MKEEFHKWIIPLELYKGAFQGLFWGYNILEYWHFSILANEKRSSPIVLR